MPPKISEEQMSARREQIIMAAVSCFADKGFHKTTMQDICKAASLSPGAVYNYYASKDEIIEAICRMGDEMNQQLFDFAGAQEYASPVAAYKSALSLFISQYKHPLYKTSVRMDAMFLAEALHNKDLANIGSSSYANVLEQIIRLVEASQADGDIDPNLSAKAVAQVLFSLVQGMSSQVIMSGDSLDIDKYLEATLAMLGGELFNKK